MRVHVCERPWSRVEPSLRRGAATSPGASGAADATMRAAAPPPHATALLPGQPDGADAYADPGAPPRPPPLAALAALFRVAALPPTPRSLLHHPLRPASASHSGASRRPRAATPPTAPRAPPRSRPKVRRREPARAAHAALVAGPSTSRVSSEGAPAAALRGPPASAPPSPVHHVSGSPQPSLLPSSLPPPPAVFTFTSPTATPTSPSH